MIISTQNVEEAKNFIRKSAEKPVVVKAQNAEFNRKILEYGKFDIFLGLDLPMNHVLAKIATKNKISVGLDLESFRKLSKKEKAVKLEKISRNLRILRKSKTQVCLMNCKDEKDAFDFLISARASTEQAKICLKKNN